jgi:hypothetical protein
MHHMEVWRWRYLSSHDILKVINRKNPRYIEHGVHPHTPTHMVGTLHNTINTLALQIANWIKPSYASVLKKPEGARRYLRCFEKLKLYFEAHRNTDHFQDNKINIEKFNSIYTTNRSVFETVRSYQPCPCDAGACIYIYSLMRNRSQRT